MSDLPTKEGIRQILDDPDTWDYVALYGPRDILRSYVNGRLVDRRNVDYEAAEKPMGRLIGMLRTEAIVHPDFYRDMIASAIKDIVDTALEGAIDNETE